MTQPIKLNLGAGEDIRKDFVNIDIRSLPNIDVVEDIITLPSFKPDTVEFIVAQHSLEYIPRPRLIEALSRWKELLQKGKSLEIRVTDIGQITKALHSNSISQEMGIPPEMGVALLYGRQAHEWDKRLSGFTSEYLQGILYSIGMEVINVVVENYDVIITAIK